MKSTTKLSKALFNSQMNKKDILTYSIIIIFLMIFGYLGINKISYFDAPNLCYISISKDLLRGDSKTIIEALNLIKKEDEENYAMVCRYVNRISESFCIASDWHLDPNWMSNANGKSCYIKGSKTLYLFPHKETDSSVVQQRATAIVQLSKLSKDFWDKYHN